MTCQMERELKPIVRKVRGGWFLFFDGGFWGWKMIKYNDSDSGRGGVRLLDGVCLDHLFSSWI